MAVVFGICFEKRAQSPMNIARLDSTHSSEMVFRLREPWLRRRYFPVAFIYTRVDTACQVRCLATGLQAEKMQSTRKKRRSRDVAVEAGISAFLTTQSTQLSIRTETDRSCHTPPRRHVDGSASYPTPESHPRPAPVRLQKSGLVLPSPFPSPRSSANPSSASAHSSPDSPPQPSLFESVVKPIIRGLRRVYQPFNTNGPSMDVSSTFDEAQATEADSDDDRMPSTPSRRVAAAPPNTSWRNALVSHLAFLVCNCYADCRCVSRWTARSALAFEPSFWHATLSSRSIHVSGRSTCARLQSGTRRS